AQGALVGVDQGEQAVQVFLQAAQVGVHVADRVVDLVGHAGGQLADGGQLLGLQQLGLGGGQPHVQLGVAAQQVLLVGAHLAQVLQQDQEPAVLVGTEVHVDQQDRVLAKGQVPAPAAVGARLRHGVAGQQRLQGQPGIGVLAAALAQAGGGGVGVDQHAGGA